MVILYSLKGCCTYIGTSAVPLLSWGSVEPFRPKFVHLWKLICASFLNEAAFVVLLYLFACNCLYRCLWYLRLFGNRFSGQTGHVDIHSFSEILAELLGFSQGIKGKKALGLKVGS